MRRGIFILIFVGVVRISFAQIFQIDQIEKEITKNAMQQTFTKQVIDLNGDGLDDLIYFYQVSEPSSIEVYLNKNGGYARVTKEYYWKCHIWDIDGKKKLHLEFGHCCGESPFVSERTYEFDHEKGYLTENYVLTSADYVGNSSELTPQYYLSKPYSVHITMDNYNLRFSPSLAKIQDESMKDYQFTLEDNTNIIAKLKKGSVAKVLSKLIKKDRTWLFVEVGSESIASKKENPINFDFANQMLRGWISEKYISQ